MHYNRYSYNSDSGHVLKAGLFGAAIGGSAALGVNLHRVGKGEITIERALAESVAGGAGTGVATAVGVAAASLFSGRVLPFVAMCAAAGSVIYMINSVGQPASVSMKCGSGENIEESGSQKKEESKSQKKEEPNPQKRGEK